MSIKKPVNLSERNASATSLLSPEKGDRPPIVVILGHVDHGKTSLVSRIKEVDLTRKEYGGISQHINAYRIEYKGRPIVLIDTPGHAAFSKMRSRGVRIADVAILVVAADEGIKPQTLEALKFIKEDKLPYLVAMNKVDMPGVNLDWLKGNLAENQIFVEGYGGDVVAVPVSAKTGLGIDSLLEMVFLVAEMNKENTPEKKTFEGVVIESRLDKGKGPVGVILTHFGKVQTGQDVWVGQEKVKVKSMFGEDGKIIKIAYPGQVVTMTGFGDVPAVGSLIKEKSGLDDKTAFAREINMSADSKLKIILKADTLGTQEAILGSLPHEAGVVAFGVGEVNESDILTAKTMGALVFAFNVGIPSLVEKLSQTEGVIVKRYNIIYELLEDIEKRILKITKPFEGEKILGKAEIIAEFEVKQERVAGCRVVEGEVSRKNKVHLERGGKTLGSYSIKSIKILKTDVEKVKAGDEFGLIFDGVVDFKIGDVLKSFQLVEE